MEQSGISLGWVLIGDTHPIVAFLKVKDEMLVSCLILHIEKVDYATTTFYNLLQRSLTCGSVWEVCTYIQPGYTALVYIVVIYPGGTLFQISVLTTSHALLIRHLGETL